MARRAVPFSQADVTRAVKGVIAAGIPRERIILVKTTPGGVELVLGSSSEDLKSGLVNEWDEVLK
ncbi:hypothetical protein [Mongoliimonas terrestris]|uniref:hypothetical protein n=1 Tax=Mongoliimonas terrestris TaxID=1709001 RepID=UPI000AD1B1FD|nr:hypothetical protein [Mongoliimonas terrestris]